MNFGFETLRFRRIQLSADHENIRSQKAIEKLGARRDGVFRNNYIDSDGISKDDVYFSIIKEEWPQLKSTVFLGFIGSRIIFEPKGGDFHLSNTKNFIQRLISRTFVRNGQTNKIRPGLSADGGNLGTAFLLRA